MTLEELENTLPSGLHDAQLHALAIDYVRRQVVLEVELDVTDPDASPKARRRTHRPARITLTGLVFCIVDAPDARYPFSDAGPLMIDSGDGQPSTAPIAVPPVPAGAFLAWLFVNEWNSFVRVAAHDARIEWLTDA